MAGEHYGKKRTVLIVEDEAINRKILKKSLQDDYTIEEAENGLAALNILSANQDIAAIILDLVMPIMNGYEFLAEYGKSEELQQIPVLVSTGDRDAESETKCLKLGACDFISKPYNINVVKLRLKNAIERSQLVLLEQLRYAADFDALTGLYNKDKLYRDIPDLIGRNQDRKFAFINFDIDNFKAYNSFFGVEEGDNLIRFMADILEKALNNIPEKLYSRGSADTFNIVIPYDEQLINSIVSELIRKLNEYRQDYHIKPSFGIYIMIDLSMSGALMHDRAKMAAEVCKGQYMQYINYYDERINEQMSKEQEIVNEMEHALETEQFVVYCQPKYSLQTNRPAGAEALVRWIHLEKGMISPGDFIPVFEKNGFVVMMDDFGSGYSSLNTLKDINVDVLKIDMKFMGKTDNPGRSENILASVVRMEKWLNMPVIAEGVELEEQVEFLKSIGCEYVQGYYFAKPMPAAEYAKLLDDEEVDSRYVGQALLNTRHIKDANDNWSVEQVFSHTPQPCGVYECSKDSAELLKANDAYYDLFGFRGMESENRDSFDMIDKEYRPKVLNEIWDAMEKHETVQIEFLRNTELGGKMWVRSYVKYLQTINDKYVCVITLTDITAQKKLEDELKRIKEVVFEEDVHIVKMLVVDDAEVTRASLRAMFEDKYIVLEAENGKEALQIIQDNEYNIDVVILDLLMPEMSGTEVIKELSKDPKMKDIPVVIMTADDSVKSQSELLELGVSDYIIKPFATEVVLKRINNVLEAEKHRKSRVKTTE